MLGAWCLLVSHLRAEEFQAVHHVTESPSEKGQCEAPNYSSDMAAFFSKGVRWAIWREDGFQKNRPGITRVGGL